MSAQGELVALGVPRVTVVIATHDRPELAQRAIRSALAQTLTELEVIVVDDASTPPFRPDVDDRRVRVIRSERSGGMCAARNVGLDAARGEWIMFLDDDDELDPEMVEHAISAAEESSLPEPVAVMTGMKIVTAEGDELERCHPPTLRRGEHYFLEGRGDTRAKNALVMPTEVVREIGGWDTQFESFEADDFGIRLNRVASIQGLDEALYLMTHHRGPRLTTRLGAIAADMKRTVAKHRAVFRRHRTRYAHYLATIGMYDLRSGRWGSAIAWCARGVARDPGRRRLWLFLAAALAGPHALRGYRRLRPRGVSVPFWVLTRRRVRKYARRLATYPRAALGVPVAALARPLARRHASRGRGAEPRSVLVCGVYRARNAPLVTELVERPRTLGWEIRLWALDHVHPDVASMTVGSGAGAKFPLLNRLLEGADPDRLDWLVVVDDDVVFPRGSLEDLLAVADAADLDLVQPAHTERSHADHAITRRRPLSVARRTTFVEIGPVFAVRRPWIGHVAPFPDEHAMGWGLELDWFDLEREGARLGIVDSVPVRHLDPVGREYASDEQWGSLQDLVAARGLHSFREIQRTRANWRVWHSLPPWSSR